MKATDRDLTTDEVAALLGVSRSAVTQAMAAGKLPSRVVLGSRLFRREDIRAARGPVDFAGSYVPSREAARLTGLGARALNRLAARGEISDGRIPGGHYRYSSASLTEYVATAIRGRSS